MSDEARKLLKWIYNCDLISKKFTKVLQTNGVTISNDNAGRYPDCDLDKGFTANKAYNELRNFGFVQCNGNGVLFELTDSGRVWYQNTIN